VRGIDERFGQDGALRGFHEDSHAKRLRDDKDVAEDDGGVEEGIAVDRLECEGAGDRRGLTAFEEGVDLADLEEFCEGESAAKLLG
jgi:hypothetical protein